MKKLTLALDSAGHQRLQSLARQRGVPQAAILREILEAIADGKAPTVSRQPA